MSTAAKLNPVNVYRRLMADYLRSTQTKIYLATPDGPSMSSIEGYWADYGQALREDATEIRAAQAADRAAGIALPEDDPYAWEDAETGELMTKDGSNPVWDAYQEAIVAAEDAYQAGCFLVRLGTRGDTTGIWAAYIKALEAAERAYNEAIARY